MALLASAMEREIKTAPSPVVVTKKKETKTYGNIYGYHFNVPVEVYSDEKYREKLDKARTLDEVERIIRDYRKHHKQKAR
ncbi:MAG: hypothetical protein QW493_04855 [Candidatus Bathyarchaeia archaeon]